MKTLRNKRKLAAVNRDNHEDHPRNKQVQNTNSSGIQKEYFTQVSDETEGGVTKNMLQVFSTMESRILSALSRLDEFLLNPQARVHSGHVPETSGNSNRENQGMNENRSQNDPRLRLDVSSNQSLQESSPEETSDRYNWRNLSRYFFCCWVGISKHQGQAVPDNTRQLWISAAAGLILRVLTSR